MRYERVHGCEIELLRCYSLGCLYLSGMISMGLLGRGEDAHDILQRVPL